ncbi:MAG: coenzyme F420-0:L-glutamate ligase [Anaerolineales bacterium]|nr:coenzyme F420-0:L-glutamate ligase [Anaerolineales bacterium]
MTQQFTLTAVSNIPQIQPGDDLGLLLKNVLRKAEMTLQAGDVLVIAQKIISKAEGRFVKLADVVVGQRAMEVAVQTDKDPRLVELILRESTAISRMKSGVLIVRHRLGFTSANAGIDRSNVGPVTADETVLLLPLDPDASAEKLRVALGGDVGVVISDSHGRPFRLGTVGVAIGVAGIPALWDRRGEPDLYGYELQHTDVGVADELAAAAGLLMGQGAEGLPVVLVRGLELPDMNGRASDLVRPLELDMYK